MKTEVTSLLASSSMAVMPSIMATDGDRESSVHSCPVLTLTTTNYYGDSSNHPGGLSETPTVDRQDHAGEEAGSLAAEEDSGVSDI